MKDLVEYLLEQGANLESTSLNGATPFMRAIQSSKPEVVQFLIDKGCKVQIENRKGTVNVFNNGK
jgi:ankyrin repeat protein